MSAILGIVSFDGRPADRSGYGCLSAASAGPAVGGHGAWIGVSAALGQQPVVAGDVAVSFDGRLDNREELMAQCGPGVSGAGEAVSDTALVLATYRAFGDHCAARLVGDFAFALYDVAAGKLLLARDVMAGRSLYYAQARDSIVFASRIQPLLAHPSIAAQPDEDGLADLVLNGHCDAHRTWFDGIWSVPPGHVVVATRDRLTVARAWDFSDSVIRYASLADYVDHFRALFGQAVRRRLRSAHPIAVAVSGGVDSSAIYCEAVRQGEGARLRGITLAYPRGTPACEHEYVDVLRKRGLPVDEVPIETVRWLMGLDQSVAWTEMPSLLWDAQDALLARARGAGCRVVIDGFFADQLLAGQSYLVDLARRGRWATLRRHLGGLRSWMTDVDPRYFSRQLVSDAARASVPAPLLRAARRTVGRVRAARRYPAWFTPRFRERAYERALDRSRPSRKFATEHARECWRRATSGDYLRAVLQTAGAGLEHGVDVVYPYRDRDLVSFLIAIPGDVVSHEGVPKALLRQATQGVLPDTIRLRRSKGDGTAFSNQAALAAEQTLRRSLGPDSLSSRAGFVDTDVLRDHMDSLFTSRLRRDDTAHIGWQVGDTLALELWLQRFCGGMSCN